MCWNDEWGENCKRLFDPFSLLLQAFIWILSASIPSLCASPPLLKFLTADPPASPSSSSHRNILLHSSSPPVLFVITSSHPFSLLLPVLLCLSSSRSSLLLLIHQQAAIVEDANQAPAATNYCMWSHLLTGGQKNFTCSITSHRAHTHIHTHTHILQQFVVNLFLILMMYDCNVHTYSMPVSLSHSFAFAVSHACAAQLWGYDESERCLIRKRETFKLAFIADFGCLM